MSRKKKKDFRFSENTIRKLKELSEILNVSETEVVSRAINLFYLQLKGEEKTVMGSSIVPFSEYQRVQEQLKQVIYKLGELEGRLKEKEEVIREKENTIQAKERLIEELRNRIKELQVKPKRWWEFWK
ncbi:hypothetical protein [Aquifex pyrophilus]